ncbi:MAG: hypothetical protein R3F65_29685 [bacterium]|nr:hypothetical protein [Myxococcales bacterium]MCB9553561.1 hypothetical protein [Myxococcales bacterium]
MRPTTLLALTLVMAASAAEARTGKAAAELQGKKGIGYARAIGGPSGLSFYYGLTDALMVEGILGIQYVSYDDEARQSQFWLDLALGAHLQILQAEQAAFTAGARLNLFTGPAGQDSAGAPADVTQTGVDIPLRAWWWPDEHISLHIETGIAFLFGPDSGVIAGEGQLEANGMVINVFDNLDADLFGHIGITFWW